MIESALELAGAGWPIFPLRARDKIPHPMLGAQGGFHHATTSLAQVEEWWTEDPAANIGSAASFALDIDCPEAMRAAIELEILETGALVKTGNGLHAHFRAVGPKTRGTARGITVRRQNGAYCAMPPSQHPSGAFYGWVSGSLIPFAELPALPELALEAIKAPEPEPLRRLPRFAPIGAEPPPGFWDYVDRLLEELASTPEGRRHTRATEVAVHLRRLELEKGLQAGHFRDKFIEAALASGLTDQEVRGHEGIAIWTWNDPQRVS